MSLIICPECGKEISDKAKACPNCGYPLENNKIVEEKTLKYSFYISIGSPSNRPSLVQIGALKKAIFQIDVDNNVFRNDLRPYDIIHIKSYRDGEITIKGYENANGTINLHMREEFRDKFKSSTKYEPIWITTFYYPGLFKPKVSLFRIGLYCDGQHFNSFSDYKQYIIDDLNYDFFFKQPNPSFGGGRMIEWIIE